MEPLKILVLHSLGNPSLAPAFLVNHLSALKKYCPEHDYCFHDTTFNVVSELAGMDFDAVVLDVTLLCARWAEDNRLETIKQDYGFIKDLRAVRLAFPQDDYDCSMVLDDWMCEWNVDVVFSAVDGYRDVLYPKFSKIGEIRLAYTGYIDDTLSHFIPSRWDRRPIDIGYRARKLPPYFGSLGENKWRIGQEVKLRAVRDGWVTDIVVGDAGTLVGESWLKFINDCKFTLGANSGSSLLDPTGSIQRSVRAFLKDFPEATFEEVEQACFPGLDRVHVFTAISPRALEAGLLESCQILVEGAYSGILKPWEHYIPIRADASDFGSVAEAMRDSDLCARLVRNCKSTLLDFKALRYESYAKVIIDTILRVSEEQSKERTTACTSPRKTRESGADVSRKSNILMLVAHEPHRDPRLAWIASGAMPDCVVHQLGISHGPNSEVSESGSREAGFVWTIPRRHCAYDLGVIGELVFGQSQSRALLELSALISIHGLSDSQLRAVLKCGESPRFENFRWYVAYILDIALTLIRYSNNLVGIDAIVAADLDTLLAGVVLKERFNVPLIYDAHEFWRAADVSQASFEHDFWVALEKRLVSQVDHAQTVSPGLAAHMSRLYGVPFFCSPNAEPLASRYSPQDGRVPQRRVGGKCRFLFQGGFAPARGIDLLIEAWPATHPDALLILRGPDSEYREEMIRLAKSLGIFGSRVLFVAPVDEAALVDAAVEFDVGLIPYTPTGLNYSNCCPNKLSQYMAAGLPILASKTVFVEQIVREAGAGSVVDFTKTDHLVKEIERFVCDDIYRIQCGERSAIFFAEQFHWEILSRGFIARMKALARSKIHLQAMPVFGYANHSPWFGEIVGNKSGSKWAVSVFVRRLWHLIPSNLRCRISPRIRRLAARLLGAA